MKNSNIEEHIADNSEFNFQRLLGHENELSPQHQFSPSINMLGSQH